MPAGPPVRHTLGGTGRGWLGTPRDLKSAQGRQGGVDGGGGTRLPIRPMYETILAFLLLTLHPNPTNVRRLTELAQVAADIASTDATQDEARMLAAIAVHESNARPAAVGDGGHSRGAFQVWDGPPTAREALKRLRGSLEACGTAELYAGCKRCGGCPRIAASLVDPSIPRR